MASVYLGLSLGPTLGEFSSLPGMEKYFYGDSSLGVIVIILVISKLKEWVEAAGKSSTWGVVFYGGMVLALMYGFSKVPSVSGFLLLGAGIAGLLFFIWWELRVESPV